MEPTTSILIVDEHGGEALAAGLSRAGFQVATAADAFQALGILEMIGCNLILTETRLPGLSGLELLRRVAARNPQIKAIVLAGHGCIAEAVEATKLGADNYLVKPIALDALLTAIRTTVEEGRALGPVPAPPIELATLTALSRLLSAPIQSPQELAQGVVDLLASLLSAGVSLRLRGEGLHEPMRVQSEAPALSGAPGRRAEQTLAARLVRADSPRHSGLIELSRPNGAPPFLDGEKALLEAAALQVSLALGNHLASQGLLQSVREMSLQTVQALVRAAEMRDGYTAGHSARVSRYAAVLARDAGLDADVIQSLRVAALLHDVGKVGISDAILNKPGPLAPDEWARMREHPAIGCQIVQGVRTLDPALPLILHHQERYDGSGYPGRLVGEQIPYGARILAVADAFEALTADRAYRQGRPVREALGILSTGAGHQWDADIVARWQHIVSRIVA